jgi:ribonuclease T2
MKKILTLFLLLTLYASARYEARPSKACPAYNNMKHTQNSHHVMLDPAKEYTVLNDHKGQKLILVKGEQPAQRWVDGECFGGERRIQSGEAGKSIEKREAGANTEAAEASSSRPEEMLLALSWHNSFCETHRNRKECRRRQSVHPADNRFVLHGLWPQPRDLLYCDVSYRLKQLDKNRQWNRLPRVPLSEEVRRELLRVMPGAASNLHRHEWIKHGTCSGEKPEAYFRRAIVLTKQLNDSKVGRFFAANTGRVVTLKQIRFKVDESFGKGSGKRAEMLCKKGMITELWFHLKGEGDDLSMLLKSGKRAKSRCRKGRIDSAGFR